MKAKLNREAALAEWLASRSQLEAESRSKRGFAQRMAEVMWPDGGRGKAQQLRTWLAGHHMPKPENVAAVLKAAAKVRKMKSLDRTGLANRKAKQ